MGDVKDISSHPKYCFRGEESPQGGDPEEYLERLPISEMTEEHSKLLADLEKEAEIGSLRVNAVCVDCEFVLDNRPWWKIQLFAPQQKDLFCSVEPKEKVIEPVTGKVAYKLHQTMFASNADPFPFLQCLFINLNGDCRFFRQKKR